MMKEEAIGYIKVAGNSTETAEYMLRNLDNSFDMGTEAIPNDVYEVIIDGMEEVLAEGE